MSLIETNRTANRKPVLGFVILSHTASPTLGRLVSALNGIYDNPPIVIHHDFSQSPLPLQSHQLGRHISIVEPYFRTRWADISLVDAFLAALELLFEKYSPDWFSFLSTECYPIASASDVLGELAKSPYDAYIESVKVKLELEPKRSWLRNRLVGLSKKLRLIEEPVSIDPAVRNQAAVDQWMLLSLCILS